MGYNVKDNLLYGIWQDRSNGANIRIVRIGGDGSWQLIGPNVSTSGTWNVGDIDTDGFYWISKAGGLWQQIDMRPGSATQYQMINSGDSSTSLTTAVAPGGAIPIDWTFLPSRPGVLFGVAGQGTIAQAQLVSWSMTSHTWTLVRNLGNTAGNNAFGALYAAGAGILYGGENTSGSIWRFNVTAGNPTQISTGPTATSNDGARCAYAAEPL